MSLDWQSWLVILSHFICKRRRESCESFEDVLLKLKMWVFLTELSSEQIKTAASSRPVKCVITIQLAAFFFLIVKTQTREQMWWETSALPFTVKSSRSYHKITFFSVSNAHTHTLTWEETVHPPSSSSSSLHPPPPPSILHLPAVFSPPWRCGCHTQT